MGSEYHDAIDMFLPLDYTFTSVAPLTIVDHCTGGDMTIQALYNNFYSSMKSSHFGIGRDGTVAQFVHLNRGAGANCCPDRNSNGTPICEPFWLPYLSKYGNLNFCGFSIEHCNDSNNSLALTDKQLLASQKLHLFLCDTYNIPVDHIKPHSSINPINKARDPGALFQMQAIKDYVTSNGGIIVAAQEQAIKDHFLSYFNMLHAIENSVEIPRTDTGIYSTYSNLYKRGIQLGPATSYEYQSVDWSGRPITCQDFGSMRIEWIQAKGPSGVFGPYGSIDL